MRKKILTSQICKIKTFYFYVNTNKKLHAFNKNSTNNNILNKTILNVKLMTDLCKYINVWFVMIVKRLPNVFISLLNYT